MGMDQLSGGAVAVVDSRIEHSFCSVVDIDVIAIGTLCLAVRYDCSRESSHPLAKVGCETAKCPVRGIGVTSLDGRLEAKQHSREPPRLSFPGRVTPLDSSTRFHCQCRICEDRS